MKVIYKITNPSGSIYIGQTKNLKRRQREYKALKCKTQQFLLQSFRKHGYIRHIFEILEEVEDNQADQRERFYISLFNSYKNGLNMTEGGRSPMPISGKDHYKSRPIYQYDLEGNFVKKWDCVSTAAKENKWNHRNIYRVVKNGNAAFGYRWLKEMRVIERHSPNKGGRPKAQPIQGQAIVIDANA